MIISHVLFLYGLGVKYGCCGSECQGSNRSIYLQHYPTVYIVDNGNKTTNWRAPCHDRGCQASAHAACRVLGENMGYSREHILGLNDEDI